jgi:hypothetical protein
LNFSKGLLAMLALGQLTSCRSPGDLLFQASANEFTSVLSQNAYGAADSRTLILQNGRSATYRPSSPQDHLSSQFFPLMHYEHRHPRLIVSTESERPSSVTIRIQNQKYEELGACDANCSVDAENQTSVRLVIQSKDGNGSPLPNQITLRVAYVSNLPWVAMLAALAGLGLCVILALVGPIIYRHEAKRIDRVFEIAKLWSAPYAPARKPYETLPGRRGYWLAVTLVIGMYAIAWGANWKYIYGWMEDDWANYFKALATIHDPKNAFLVRANLLQPYFFLFSYLPLWLRVRIPSVDIPAFGANTGLFRFFLLYTVGYHVGVAFAWAWLAEKLVWRQSAAVLSLVFLLSSPTFVLWTPQPDSRVVGLPLVFVGIWLLTRKSAPTALSAGFAGFLFSLANNLHYTSMYLTIPASVVLCGLDLLGRWHQRKFWVTWSFFAAGVASVVLSLELVSHYWIGIPVLAGPAGALLASNSQLQSSFTRLQNLALWARFSWNLIGIPMLLAAVAGVYIFSARRDRSGPDHAIRIAVVLIVAMGMTWILLSGSIPFFRQTSVLQPFMFLFAAVAITEVASRAKAPAMRLFVLAVLTVLVAWTPAVAAYQVFAGHLGFGRVIQWVEQNKGSRRVGWLMPRVAEYSPVEYLGRFSDNDWIVVHSAMRSNQLAGPFANLQPLKAGPGIWGTYAAYAETFAWNHSDVREYKFYSDTRVYRIGDVAASLRDWNQATSSQSPLVITRIEPIPPEEFAQTETRLMIYFRPYPDPLPYKRVWVFGDGLNINSILAVDGKALPTRVDDFHLESVRLIAVLPDAYHGCAEALVKDGTRRSNAIQLCIP